MLPCDFMSSQVDATRYQLVCRRCGAMVIAESPSAARDCNVNAAIRNEEALKLRKEICRECFDRPAGCWKAIEYSCQQRYREAQERAAIERACPLGKLM